MQQKLAAVAHLLTVTPLVPNKVNGQSQRSSIFKIREKKGGINALQTSLVIFQDLLGK